VADLNWTAPAVADLMAIVDYISDDNPDAALALMSEIESRVATLPDQPKRGRSGRVAGTRELVVRPNYGVPPLTSNTRIAFRVGGAADRQRTSDSS
jgi:addiction module RelE/StbE family toxin